MSPDEIKDYLSKHYPSLKAEPLKYGWSFWFDPPQGGANSSRIIRANQSGSNVKTYVKLSVSSRHEEKMEQRFVENAAHLRSLVDTEIALYLKHYAKSVRK